METMTEKTDGESSVAELQEKIGIFLTVLFHVNSLGFWIVSFCFSA